MTSARSSATSAPSRRRGSLEADYRTVRHLLSCGFTPEIHRDEWGHVAEVSFYNDATRTGASWTKGTMPRRELEELARYVNLHRREPAPRRAPRVQVRAGEDA